MGDLLRRNKNIELEKKGRHRDGPLLISIEKLDRRRAEFWSPVRPCCSSPDRWRKASWPIGNTGLGTSRQPNSMCPH